MKKKRVLQVLAVTCVIAAALLFLYLMGVFGQETQISQSAQKEIEKTGIFMQLTVEPEAGIFPGDILEIKTEILFDPLRMEIDAKKIAEEYVKFKESSFQGCEEYRPAKLERRKRGSLRQIELRASFQCWITEVKEISPTLPIQYTEKENRITSTPYLSKRLRFAALSLPQNPRPLAEHTASRNSAALLFTALGVAAIFAALAWIFITSRLRRKSSMEQETATLPDARMIRFGKIREALDHGDLNTAYDRMYHILLDLETKDEHLCPSLKPLKNRLQKVYENGTLSQQEARDILRALENLPAKGGDAK